MKYLGAISGTGVLQHKGIDIADATYGLEGYIQRKGYLTGSGEIGLTSDALQSAIEQPSVQLLTNKGLLLGIKFLEKELRADDCVLVEFTGALPHQSDWQA